MLKQKKFFKLACIMAIFLFIICIAVMQGISASAFASEETNKNAVDFISSIFGKKVQTLDYLYNFDESADFIYAEFEGDGYAVLYKDTFEPLEYSMTGRLKSSDNEEKIYYGGPASKFVKKQGAFSNLNTDERVVLSTTQSQEMAQSTRKNFSGNAKNSSNRVAQLKNSIENYHQEKEEENSPLSVPTYDKDLHPDFEKDGNYIPNYAFFKTGPAHGNNVHGTCTIVATQLLLSYHNYFSDRRIIDDSYLFQASGILSVVNPNTCNDPMALTVGTTGSNNDYYEYLIDTIDPSVRNCEHTTDADGNTVHSYRGASLKQAANGINKILKEREVSGKPQYDIGNTTAPLDSKFVLSILNKGQPMIITIYNFQGDPLNPTGAHAVVVYGYANYTYPESYGGGTYQGYIAHMGWGNDQKNVWINSTWCYGYLTLDIEHEHNYDTYVGGFYREEKCSACGHRRYAYETNILSNTEVEITGTTQTFVEEQVTLPSKILGRNVVKIGDYAFEKTEEENEVLTDLTLPSELREIGDGAFFYRTQLKTAPLPSTVKKIGEKAFFYCGLESITIPAGVSELKESVFSLTWLKEVNFAEDSSLLVIRKAAFQGCGQLKHIRIPANTWIIEEHAFSLCSGLESVALSKVSSIHSNAFSGCNKATFYSSVASSNTTWSQGWNSLNRPIVLGCELTFEYVKSFTKTNTNPSVLTDIKNPRRYGYTFAGWYTTSDFSGDSYTTIADAPNAKLFAKWNQGEDTSSGSDTGSGSCVAEGSLITLADGSQKAVEELTGDEDLLVWNMLTGEFDTAPILFIDSDPLTSYEVITLTFADGTEVKVIDEHAFFDMTIGEYIFLRKDAAQYIGHYFNKQSYDENNNMVWTSVQLTGVTVDYEQTTAWSPVTYGHLCYYVNGMLSMPGATEGFINIFDVDMTLMKYDEEQMEEDIETYGLYTYEEFNAIIPLPEVVFNAFNGQYLKVSIGKGLITLPEIAALLQRYAEFFN